MGTVQGASPHMSPSQGRLLPYFNLSKHHEIIVGNDHSIPINDFGTTKLSSPNPPSKFKNVLHAPKIFNKKTVFVRKCTTDNRV